MKIRKKINNGHNSARKRGAWSQGPRGTCAPSREGPRHAARSGGAAGSQDRGGTDGGGRRPGVGTSAERAPSSRARQPRPKRRDPRASPDADSRPAPTASPWAESWRTLLTNCSRADAMFPATRRRRRRTRDEDRRPTGGPRG